MTTHQLEVFNDDQRPTLTSSVVWAFVLSLGVHVFAFAAWLNYDAPKVAGQTATPKQMVMVTLAPPMPVVSPPTRLPKPVAKPKSEPKAKPVVKPAAKQVFAKAAVKKSPSKKLPVKTVEAQSKQAPVRQQKPVEPSMTKVEPEEVLVKKPLQPVPVSAEAPEAETDQYQAELKLKYLAELEIWFQQNKHYPRKAKMRGIVGDVEVEVTLNRFGKILKHQLISESGYRVLDHAVLKTLQQAEGIPPFPDEFQQVQLTVTVPFEYRLN